jgi:protein-tyrosine phosphatase
VPSRERALRAEDLPPGVVDLHNHLIPAVDDGAQTVAQAEDGLRAFAADNVTAFVVTPHVELGIAPHGGMEARLLEIDAGWATLQTLAAKAGLDVYRGAELRLDIAEPDLSDPRLRLAGTRFVLVEFPYFVVPPRSHRVIASLVASGWIPILAHPERYAGVDADLEVVTEWRDAGAYLQVTGGSLLGRYGTTVQRMAARLLERGYGDYLSSDYHARHAPRIGECIAYMESVGARQQADRLTRINPRRMLAGERPLPVEGVMLPQPRAAGSGA